ncbi:D(2) dopamine receptor A-like [Babylonia areolata]|uniref:D(2) dopamine receptor A-like n=1 Tax=Babylonia areolata TaxID=304850 RepID=UPI003FD0581F
MCLSSESFKQRMPVVVYLSVVSVLGVTGNIVVMWVFSLDSRVTSYRIFVLCMGVQDFLTSSLGLPLQLLSIRHAYNTYSTLFCRAMFALTTLPTQASSAILVAVALDRLHRVCWPHVRHLTPREALRVCVLLTVFVWCVFAAFIPLYGINNYPSAVPGLDVKMCWIYDDFVSTQYVTVYSIVVEIIFYLSMFLMTGAYFMIGVKIWRQFLRKRKIIAETSNEEHFASTVHLKNSACSVKLLPSIALLSSSVDNARDAGSVKDVPDTVPLLSTSVHNKSEDEGRAEQCKPSSPVPENSRLPRRTGNQLKTTRKRLTFDVQPHQPGASANRKLSMGVSPTVARAYARRLSSGRSIHRHRRKTSHTTFMMAMLALCYVINWMPHLIIRLNNLDPIDLCSQFTCCDNRDALSLRSYYLSSAVNVFVYSIWSETFQATCRQLFRKYWNKLRQPSSMSRGL